MACYDLIVDQLVIARCIDRAEDANRLGKSVLVTHAAEQVGQTWLGAAFVVEQQIVFGNPFAQLDDFGLQAVQTNALVAIFAKNQRLAMLQFQRRVRLGVAILGVFPGTVVEDVAVLIDLDERGAADVRQPV